MLGSDEQLRGHIRKREARNYGWHGSFLCHTVNRSRGIAPIRRKVSKGRPTYGKRSPRSNTKLFRILAFRSITRNVGILPVGAAHRTWQRQDVSGIHEHVHLRGKKRPAGHSQLIHSHIVGYRYGNRHTFGRTHCGTYRLHSGFPVYRRLTDYRHSTVAFVHKKILHCKTAYRLNILYLKQHLQIRNNQL